MGLTCAECDDFTPDPIGRGGLGKCAAKHVTGDVLKRQWEGRQWVNVWEKRLTYPGSAACEVCREKPVTTGVEPLA